MLPCLPCTVFNGGGIETVAHMTWPRWAVPLICRERRGCCCAMVQTFVASAAMMCQYNTRIELMLMHVRLTWRTARAVVF